MGSEGILTPSGRDIQDERPITFRFDNGTWIFLGPKSEIDRTETQNSVLSVLKNSLTPLSFTEITRISGVKSGSAGKVLETLISQGVVEKLSNKSYRHLESKKVQRDNTHIN